VKRTSAREFFDAVARRYDRDYALSGAASRERMTRVLEAIRGKRRVLVLGIGTGRELPALLDAGHDVEGLDFSAEMIASCNKRSRTVPIVQADFWSQLPFPDARFDAAIALHGTLAHPPDDAAIAALGAELARVLAPGGVFVAEVPAREALDSMGVRRTGETSFLHEDAALGVALEGVALDAKSWIAALAPFEVAVTPLGAAEHLVVARRRASI
jgi:SAM-dependent methyltransferase